jgi:hypothetical protein
LTKGAELRSEAAGERREGKVEGTGGEEEKRRNTQQQARIKQ